jgi:pimeloyl-ACP methyl ester carboxylesterase
MKRIIVLAGLTVLLMLTTAVIAQNTDGNTTNYGRNEKAGKYAGIRGIKMYYETYGAGEPLLIIHGNGGSIKYFTSQIPYFSQHYKVILADSRAQGKTIDTGDSLSYEMMADDLIALLDKLGIDSANVIGWSDGGINGLLMAMRQPKKVKKLAITGANLWPDSTAVEPFVYKWAMGINDSVSKLTITPQLRGSKKLLHLLSYEPHINVNELKKVSCPTLVMGGDHDVILPQHTMLIARSIPRSYLWIVPNSGHSVPIFYKDLFNSVVQDFFSKPYRKIEGFGTFN